MARHQRSEVVHRRPCLGPRYTRHTGSLGPLAVGRRHNRTLGSSCCASALSILLLEQWPSVLAIFVKAEGCVVVDAPLWGRAVDVAATKVEVLQQSGLWQSGSSVKLM